MYRWILPLLLLSIVVVLAGCPKEQAATAPVAPPAESATKAAATPVTGEIKAYIPCGLIVPLHAAIETFEAQNPQAKVKAVYDNAPVIVKRLTNKGEITDVVVTPGNTEMAMLEAKDLIDTANRKSIGSFELVCIVPSNSKKSITKPADLKQLKTIAMPNPEMNSTGASGKAALTKLGLWEALQPKMIMPTHAIEGHTMVAAGKADAGIAYKNCPLETAPEKLSKSKVKIAFSFPADSYEQQPCLAALSTKAPNKTAAVAFIGFLTSPAGMKILADNGMTGCMAMAACPGNCADGGACAHEGGAKAPAGKSAAKPDITVIAFFPGDEKHGAIRQLVEDLPKTYGERVSGKFVDFTTEEGFKIWHDEKGLSCGSVLINDQQTWTYEPDGKVKEVTFKMGIGGEWTADDLHGVVKKLLKEKK